MIGNAPAILLDIDVALLYKANPFMAMKTKALYRLFAATVSVALFMGAGHDASAQRLPNMFVADYLGGNIYEISPLGAPTVFTSGLNYPNGLAFDSAGNLFETDGGSGNVYEFVNQDGELNSNPVVFASGFDWPSGMAFDNKGNLFVADSDNIYQLAPDGTESTFAPAAPFVDWTSVAVNSKGDLFVATQYSDEVDKFTPSGNESIYVRAPAVWGETALAFNKADELYVANYYTNAVINIKPKKQKIFASTYNPWSMVFDDSGNLYVADGTLGDIIKISPKGKQETIATNVGDPAAIVIQPPVRYRRQELVR